MTERVVVQYLAGAILILLGLGFCAGRVTAHGIYEHWTSPDNPGLSCCHGQDCKPARAYIHDDGLWRAWDGSRWLTVPPGKLLPVDYAGDGRSHLCSRAGQVLCFSPTSPKG